MGWLSPFFYFFYIPWPGIILAIRSSLIPEPVSQPYEHYDGSFYEAKKLDQGAPFIMPTNAMPWFSTFASSYGYTKRYCGIA